jgi:Holliday junction resolvase-like predicted endonuclease
MNLRIRPQSVDSEAMLEQLIIAAPDNLEDGLKVLDNQVAAGSGFIDILAADASDHALVIIELKKEESDRMLAQTIEYYDFVRENIERFASAYRHKSEIDEHAEPRIMLVAHSFSETLQVATKYINAPVSLFQYEYLQMGDQRGLYMTEVPVSSPREFNRRRKTPGEQVRALCQQVSDRIVTLDTTNITIKGLRGRIAFKYAGRNFANIFPRQSFFSVNWKGHWKERFRVESKADFTEAMFSQIEQAMKTLASGAPDGDNEGDLADDSEQ